MLYENVFGLAHANCQTPLQVSIFVFETRTRNWKLVELGYPYILRPLDTTRCWDCFGISRDIPEITRGYPARDLTQDVAIGWDLVAEITRCGDHGFFNIFFFELLNGYCSK